MRVFLAGDHAGYELRQYLVGRVRDWGHEPVDLGSASATESVDYPDYVVPTAERVARGEGLGILVCGTGMGVSIAANKVAGIRAARCTDTFSARMARAHNDANVLCLGGWITGRGLAEDMARAFLDTAFEGGRHQRRVEKMAALDRRDPPGGG
ncbi:MAG TPA: ribose 5-phosphate isomerase B [Polyangia bacterium]